MEWCNWPNEWVVSRFRIVDDAVENTIDWGNGVRVTFRTPISDTMTAEDFSSEENMYGMEFFI